MTNDFNRSASARKPLQKDIDTFVAAARKALRTTVRKYLAKFRTDIVNAPSTDGHLALIEAAGNGHHELVALMLETGADVMAQDRFGNTALASAEKAGALATADLIRAEVGKIEGKCRAREAEEAAKDVYAGIEQDISVRPIRFKKKGPAAP